MLFIIALLIAVIFTLLCEKPLKKYPYIFYAAAIIITILSSILAQNHISSQFINTYIIGLFTRGAFPTALWIIVMWIGAMPNGSAAIKKIMPIRGELSIFAAILTLGHNIGYGKVYFVRLLTNADKMSYNQIVASILTIIMLIIMIPLTIMSFKQIRRKMNAKLWKKIQRTAYLFYALIYVHVMVLIYPLAKSGRDGYLLNIIVYTAVFIGYAVCRIRKWLIVSKKIQSTIILNVVPIVVFVIVLSGTILFAKAEKSKAAFNIRNQSVQISSESDTNNEISAFTTIILTTTDTKKKTTIQTTTTSTSTSVAATLSDLTINNVTSVAADETSLKEIEPKVTYADVNENSYESQTKTEKTNNQPITNEVSNQHEKTVPTAAPNLEIKATEAQKTVTIPPVSAAPTNTPTEAPTDPPAPQYIYNDGTFSGSAYGYDGNIYVTITIQNDVITSISGSTDESDDWYFNSASGYVMGQIQSSQSPYVDAYSGATYSSNAIMNAVNSALNSARK